MTDYVLPKEMEGYDSGDPEWNARLIAWREASDGEFIYILNVCDLRCTSARTWVFGQHMIYHSPKSPLGQSSER